MDSRPILIAGAGIGGLAAAVALRRAGFEVEIFERAGQLREIGAGITLWINAMTALRRLGLEDRIRELSAPLDRNEIWLWKGHMLTRVSVVELARELGAQPVGIERGKLLSVLHEAVGDTPIHLENRVIGTGRTATGSWHGSRTVERSKAAFSSGRTGSAPRCGPSSCRMASPFIQARRSGGASVTRAKGRPPAACS